MSEDLLELTAAQAIARIEAGELDADAYFGAYADRARSDEGGSFLWVASEPPPADSNGGPLAGVPLAVKDIFCTEGIPTTAGSRILEGYRPPYTATAVQRLEQAGARLLGKANMDEFAMGSSNENSAYSPVRNPWDAGRVPGGSSGGSAAAVAGLLAPWAIGTDTGGSIRQPASLCGLVGLKPTYGAISRYGMVAFASSLDQAGPLTRDVTDAALLLRVMQGRDAADSTSLGIPGGLEELPGRTDLRGLRIGVPEELGPGTEGIEEGVAGLLADAQERIGELGGEVEPTSLPSTTQGISAYYVLAPAEASANLARYDGMRFGFRAEAEDLVDMYERTRGAGFGPEVKRRIMLGTYALSSGYYEAYYGRAQRVRTLIRRDFARAFERYDLLLTPTSPTVAFGLGERTEDPLAMYLSDYCTVPMSLAGLPALSLPAGLARPDGGGPELPVGIQLTGPAFSEGLLLDAAHALERSIVFDPVPPALRGGTGADGRGEP